MILGIKVDKKLEMEARIVAEKFGFSLETILIAYLKEFVRTKKVGFPILAEN